MKPLARTEGLVVTELPDELLVYDLERHRAHCLNPTAALVFKHCDGRRSVAQIARILRRELDMDPPADEGLVWLSLERLERARLLEERPAAPAAAPGYSRRELVRRVGLAAATLPVVATILAPTPAEALASGCIDYNTTPCQDPADDGVACDCASKAFCDGICSAGVCVGGTGC
jgi:Coenzyme PQQ synthesis protein D (PqqD)